MASVGQKTTVNSSGCLGYATDADAEVSHYRCRFFFAAAETKLCCHCCYKTDSQLSSEASVCLYCFDFVPTTWRSADSCWSDCCLN